MDSSRKNRVPSTKSPAFMDSTTCQYPMSDQFSMGRRRMSEMQIVLYDVIDKCSDILRAAHILPICYNKSVLPV